MRLASLMRFARLHRVRPVLVGVALVALLSAVLGGFEVPVPTLGNGVTKGIPFRRDLPMLSSVFLAASWASAMDVYERIGGPRYFRTQAVCLTVLTSTVCLCSFLVQALATDTSTGAVYVRSMLVWLGLALLSGRALGPSLTWALPVASAFPLIWLSDRAWWDWTAAPAADPAAWATAALSLTLGTLAVVAATPWRLRTARCLMRSGRRESD
ncbi:hypothetical protein ACWDXT_16855 [Streptomyces sp. NPDC003236]